MRPQPRPSPLRHRISEQTDTNDAGNTRTADGKVDAADPVFFIATDLGGRRVATYRGRDQFPKEQFAYHMPGTGAGGGGSAGAVGPILRTRDEDAFKPTNWATQAGQAVHPERFFYTSDFRGNVSAIVSSGGNLIEQYRYSATGVPFGIPHGDVNADGLVGTPSGGGGGGGGTLTAFTASSNADSDPDYDQTEYLMMNNMYEVRADWNLDGVIDAADAAVVAEGVGNATGRKAMSAAAVGNRIGAENSEEDVAGINDNGSGDTLVRSTMLPLNGGPVSKKQRVLRPVGAPGASSYTECVAGCAASFGWFGDRYESCVDDWNL